MNLINSLKEIFIRRKTYLIILILIIWSALIFIFCKDNISNPGLWFDEAGQFWMGKGLNHYSTPFSPEGGLTQVLQNNAHFNLDPGGFSVITHYWTMISDSLIFLKILPFLFFLIAMILVTYLCLIWKPKNWVAYFGGFILILSPLLTQYAFEFRPYSMEMLTAVLALYFCYKIPSILNNWCYALFSGTVLAVLLSSRYSALFSIVSLGILVFSVLIYNIFIKKISKNNVINFVFFVIPIIISAILIYIFTLRYQNPTGLPPSYVTDLMFKTTSVSRVLCNKAVLITTLPFLLLTLAYLISIMSSYFKNITKPYRLYFIYALILNSIFILLSIFGKYPWGINSRWDISTHVIFTVAWLPILFMISDLLYKKDNYLFKILQVIFVLFFVYHIFVLAKDFKYSSLDSTYTNFISNNIPLNSKVLINVGADPTVRYLFEYGSLKDEKYKNIYNNISWFNHAEYILPNSVANLKGIDNYDHIILTMFNWDSSEIKDILDKKTNWVDITKSGPSKTFKNNR